MMYFLSGYVFLNSIVGVVLYFVAPVTFSPLVMMLIVGLASFVIMIVGMLINIALKWLLLGKIVEGDYPLWGNYHMRLWFIEGVNGVVMATYGWLLNGTPILTWYLRAMGCRIGNNVVIHGSISGFDLVEIGDGCMLNGGSSISASTIEGGMISFRRVKLGDDVTLGTKAMVQEGVTIGDNAILDHMCCVAPNQVVGSNEKWVGSPAEFDGMVPPPEEEVKVSAALHTTSSAIPPLTTRIT